MNDKDLLSQEKLNELISRGYESTDVDYKESFDKSNGSWAELAKDAYGLANFGGGYIFLGVRDGTWEPVGLDVSFEIDTEQWVNGISKWLPKKIDLAYKDFTLEINGVQRKFGCIYIKPSIGELLTPKDDGTYTKL